MNKYKKQLYQKHLQSSRSWRKQPGNPQAIALGQPYRAISTCLLNPIQLANEPPKEGRHCFKKFPPWDLPLQCREITQVLVYLKKNIGVKDCFLPIHPTPDGMKTQNPALA